ncbi:MAG: LytTR family DNA-binding domain-containing protein [Bacteroidota bacterium]
MNASSPFRRISPLVLIFGLWVFTVGYYQAHFPRPLGPGYATFFVLLVAVIYWTGVRLFHPGEAFPYGYFSLATFSYGVVRWLYTYWVLQHYLPDDTVFAHPERAPWYLFPTSALLLFTGYGIAQYRYLRHNSEPKAESAPAQIPVPAPAPTPQIAFRSSGKEIRLPITELIRVQANGEYLLYHCRDRRYQRFQRLKEAEVELRPFGFVRIHRSHLVARRAVRSFSTTTVELEDGTVLPVSKTYRGTLS